jgi:hypothetical protein
MTIHEPGSPSHAFHCTVPGCTGPRSCGAGYASETAAAKAETHHIQRAHPRLTATAGAR